MDPKVFALITAISFGLNPVTLKLGFGRGGRPDTAMILGLVVAVPIYLAILPFGGGLHWDQVTLAALFGLRPGWAVRDGDRPALAVHRDRPDRRLAGDGDQELRAGHHAPCWPR